MADWLSRSGCAELSASSELNCFLAVASATADDEFESIMRAVHGGRNLHYGWSRTWELAKKSFPQATISQAAVKEYVRTCPICQKTRDVGIRPLSSRALTLKPATYRTRIGIDHVAMTPADRHGNRCLILIVEHFSHFPQAYAAADYTAETVARVLFSHITVFGVFDELISDPGSAFLSEVVVKLVSWLGMRHKISLVERHESNGCEGISKQYIRHLTTICADINVKDNWSDPTVLGLINFAICSYPTRETGGFTPFELKYGPMDAPYMRLPNPADLPSNAPTFLRSLAKNIDTVRRASLQYQNNIAADRSAAAGVAAVYEPGDLVLWDLLELPTDHKPTKLTPRYSGPYEVVTQTQNDVQCKHVNLGTVHTFHVERLHAFFGSRDDALRVARLDQDQYEISAINYYTENVFKRQSLLFNVSFADGSVIDLPLTPDLYPHPSHLTPSAYRHYCLSDTPQLPLQSLL